MARRCASSEVNGKEAASRRSDRFLHGLHDSRSVTFVSHVHPDPDSLGSMLGLAHLVDTCLGKPTRLVRDGVIGRAENRAMVELLDIDLCPIDQFTWKPGEAVVMVDSQPNTGRHNFAAKIPLYGVIDHHDTRGDLGDVSFIDVRQTVGATSSLVTSYLTEQAVSIPKRLATGLLYAIETELDGYPREASKMDESALQYLYPLADKNLLASIRHARLPQSYFGCLVQALQSSFIYDRLIVSWINELPQPELAAEVADFLLRFEAVDWVLAAGVHEDKLLKYLRIEECRGQRLVSRKEMLQNLQG